MKVLVIFAAASALFAQIAQSAQIAESPVRVIRRPSPDKALVFEVMVAASPAAVWQVFYTRAGLSTWLTPGAEVELRKGGECTAHFPGGSTGGGTILDFVPLKEMTIAALAPEQFPTVRAQRTTARFQFARKGESTVVTLVQTGWKTGEEWDRAYDYLAAGNAQLLEALQRRFVSGPFDWEKEWSVAVTGKSSR